MSAIRSAMRGVVSSVANSPFGGFLLQLGADSIMSRSTEVEHDGTRLRFVTPNRLNKWRATSFSSKEPETLQWIDSFEPGATLWDIGANVGLYSCYAALRRQCRVYSFEPSPFNVELLARNVWLNELSSRVTIVPLPLSDAIVDSTLNMSTTAWGGALSTFDRTYGHDGAQLAKVFEFRTVGMTMNDAVRMLHIPQPDFIKIDVDGIEHLILKGGADVLAKTRAVLIEINEDFEEQTVKSQHCLEQAGLELAEKRHAAMFESGEGSRCYNQIWRRPGAK
jgi:FkbM family methyltransferase